MYFEVVVEIRLETEDSRGGVRIKKIKEIYLVDAMSVTEAEARVVKLFKDFSQDYGVIGVKQSKIAEVINADDKEKTLRVVENARQLAKEKDDDGDDDGDDDDDK